MKSGRLKNAMLNSSILTLIQMITIILRFINQTVFIYILGKQFLGLNGLFTNILSFLAFAELGIGTSIIFSLYRPLADKNDELIAALMNFIRKAYYFIGIVIAIVGLVLIPFLPIIIKDYGVVKNIPFYYVLYLANSVVSYFFTYKRSILIADQHEYISSLNSVGYLVIQTILQIIVLILLRSYAIYLVIAILSTLFSNINISRAVDKRYPYLRKNKYLKIGKSEAKLIRNNIVGMVGSRIGSIVVRSTDNILLSAFLGLSIVGMYSNYLLIVTSVSTILNKLASSVTASVGNLIAENKNERSLFIFKTHFMINFFIVSFSAAGLLVALNPFIKVWAGSHYVLASQTVLVIVLNYFIDQLRQTSITFITAYGLFIPNGKKSILEAALNLMLSLTFLRIFNLDIAGVLLGTVVTNIILNSWWEPLLLFQQGFSFKNKFLRFYIKEYLINVIFMGFCIFVIYLGTGQLDNIINTNNGLVVAIVNVIVSWLILILIIGIFYRKNDGFQYLLKIIKSLVKLKRKEV